MTSVTTKLELSQPSTGGHVARCEDCAHIDIAYNSCLMGKICNGELAGVDVARMAH